MTCWGCWARDEQIRLGTLRPGWYAGPWRVAANLEWANRAGLDKGHLARATHLVGLPAAAWCPPRRWKNTSPPLTSDLFQPKNPPPGGFFSSEISKMARTYSPAYRDGQTAGCL